MEHQEKGDALFRSLGIPVDVHDGVYWDYVGNDPDDLNNSELIEMLGGDVNRIISNTTLLFRQTTVYRGAFTHPRYLSRERRKAITDTMRAMQLRSPAITYVSYYQYEYLDWADDNEDGHLQIDEIIDMRSDAVVEFAYAKNFFPILTPLGETIITKPNKFRLWAFSTIDKGGLSPLYQQNHMVPSFAIDPVAVVYDGNNNVIFSEGASSSTEISVYVFDEHSGPGGIELWAGDVNSGSLLASNYDEIDDVEYHYHSTDTGLSGFSGLTDGRYTIRAIDQAANWGAPSTISFTIDTSSVAITPVPAANPTSTGPITNNDCPAIRTSAASGVVKSWCIFTSSGTYPQPPPKGFHVTGTCGISSGTYTCYAENRAGTISSAPITITHVDPEMILTGGGGGWGQTNSVGIPGIGNSDSLTITLSPDTPSCSVFTASINGVSASCQGGGGSAVQYEATIGPPPKSASWEITNVSGSSYASSVLITADIGYITQITFNAAPHPYTLSPGGSLSGNVTIPQYSDVVFLKGLYASTITVTSPFNGMAISTRAALTGAEDSSRLRQVLRQSGHIVDISGVDGAAVIFNSTMSLSFAYLDAVADTTTARIYQFTGSAWESNSISSQTITRSSNDVTATGVSSFTSTFVVFYDGHDSSAPITTFAIQGSSFVFDQTLFVSTDAYAVLTATDPIVNGFASTVATTTYRLDPSSGSAFVVYPSSIPLPLGTHVFEYRSIDYAGNIETIKTATFTVTAGTGFRTANTAVVPGALLNGFLGSGAKLEIESQAQNSSTLLISSANRQALISVDNIGEVGIGVTPQTNLNIGQSSIGLQLRSGNSTSSVTSDQITFGYNGDYAMRHFLRTEHSTSTDGNKMDFLVWNTGAGSTTTVASLNTLSLQGIATASGGSFHVQPVGEPDAEVEVSNGLATGGGTMQRLQVVSPSSRRFKTDIKELSEKEEDKALGDVSVLKHAHFRYKTRLKGGRLVDDPGQILRNGLIYEDAPDSIRDGGEALSTSERLVNVEMALKASMRRLEELQKRYDRLKARRNP